MKLRITRRAGYQIDKALASIPSESPLGAVKVGERIREALTLLQSYPHSGRLTDRARVRRFVLAPFPYILFYRADADAIVVLGLRHAARRPL